MIPFSKPFLTGNEQQYIASTLNSRALCGDRYYTKECQNLLHKMCPTNKILLTTSCTHSLEMAAILIDIHPDDEVIMPSYTFVSTANAFLLRGAQIVFVDIRPDTMNIDESKIEAAITDRTKAIIPVHYAGVACEMDTIMDIAQKYNLYVIEDAAQGINAFYKGKALGTIGDMGCFSFHESKNIHCGEGGALLINNETFIDRAEIIREKGTDRSKFLRGQIDKYSWQDIGSSYLVSELNAAFLLAQLEESQNITNHRLHLWNTYYENLLNLPSIELPHIPDSIEHNAHMFYIKVKDIHERDNLISFLKENDIMAVFHYIPLHSSNAGRKYSRFHGEDLFTTYESERLLRLSIFSEMTIEDALYVSRKVRKFFDAE